MISTLLLQILTGTLHSASTNSRYCSHLTEPYLCNIIFLNYSKNAYLRAYSSLRALKLSTGIPIGYVIHTAVGSTIYGVMYYVNAKKEPLLALLLAALTKLHRVSFFLRPLRVNN